MLIKAMNKIKITISKITLRIMASQYLKKCGAKISRPVHLFLYMTSNGVHIVRIKNISVSLWVAPT